MFRTRTTDVAYERPIEARGGISGGAILTGVLVAFGAMVIFGALIGGALAALGIAETDITRGEAVDAGIGAGIAFVVAQFLAYTWGGYTAGRMGRGTGVGNGILVPIVAIILAVATGAVVASLGATANLNLPFTENRLPLENDYLVSWGIGIGVAALIAMFLGGAVGGGLGARWHTKLEEDVYGETPITTKDGIDREHVATGSVATAGTVPTTGGAAAANRTIDVTEPVATERRTYR